MSFKQFFSKIFIYSPTSVKVVDSSENVMRL